jgi:hypothetical protein
MRQRDVILIGPFTEGEIPVAIPVSFLTEPQSLDGWGLRVTCERDGVELAGWGEAEWSDAPTALALLYMPELELDPERDGAPSVFEVQVWAGNASQRIASLVIRFHLNRAIGTIPVV